MAVFDIFIASLIFISAAIGLGRGFVKESLSLASWIGATFGALFFGPVLATTFPDSWADSPVGQVLAFIVMLAFLYIVLLNIQWTLIKLVKSAGLTGTDRFLGFVFGALRGGVLATVLVMVMQTFEINGDWWKASVAKDYLLQFEDEIWGGFELANEAVQDIQEMSEELDKPETVEVPDEVDIEYDYDDYEYEYDQ